MNHDANISRADFLRKFPVIFFEKLKPFWEEEIVSAPPAGASIPRVDISRCLAWGQMECQFCYLACPHRDKAIEMREHKPVIIAAGCDGCAMCVDACKTVNNTPALEMVPVSQ
jgi:Pyruvate/2-oxoacid:ferredoxin oxidoreductase delta subunit